MEEALRREGIYWRKGIQSANIPVQRIDRAKSWGKFCKHYKTRYAAIVREFYSNLVGRKDNSVFVKGVWVP